MKSVKISSFVFLHLFSLMPRKALSSDYATYFTYQSHIFVCLYLKVCHTNLFKLISKQHLLYAFYLQITSFTDMFAF